MTAEMGFDEEDLQKNQVLSNGIANFKIVESHKPAAQPPASSRDSSKPVACQGANQFDAARVEADWFDFYKANPQSIGTAERSEFNEEAYDEFYGKGTFKAFQEAKRRAAERAKGLHTAKLKHPNASHSYYESF
ncbi:hypothetical protein M3Y99_01290400 [Aphelenchoides fujianensis]|nr:hypothetical protein M3Y99_01290400 [Aphelenchoides fujianensis]